MLQQKTKYPKKTIQLLKPTDQLRFERDIKAQANTKGNLTRTNIRMTQN